MNPGLSRHYSRRIGGIFAQFHEPKIQTHFQSAQSSQALKPEDSQSPRPIKDPAISTHRPESRKKKAVSSISRDTNKIVIKKLKTIKKTQKKIALKKSINKKPPKKQKPKQKNKPKSKQSKTNIFS